MDHFIDFIQSSKRLYQGGAIRSYLLMKGFVVRTMLLSVCFLLCKLEVNNQCNQSPIESRNWNFLAFYEKVCWYNLNSIEKTVLRSNGLCRTWYYSQFGLYDNSTRVDYTNFSVIFFLNFRRDYFGGSAQTLIFFIKYHLKKFSNSNNFFEKYSFFFA